MPVRTSLPPQTRSALIFSVVTCLTLDSNTALTVGLGDLIPRSHRLLADRLGYVEPTQEVSTLVTVLFFARVGI